MCDVSAPSTAKLDRILKMAKYAENGVTYIWLIEPAVKVVEVFRLDGSQWVRIQAIDGEAEAAQLQPFDAVELDLTRWWID